MVSCKNSLSIITCFVLILLCEGCSQKKSSQYIIDNHHINWNKLENKKVFFGHQSVGNNIIAGIGILKSKDPSLKHFTIKNINEISGDNDALLLHANIGINTNPISKIDDFAKYIRTSGKDSINIAVMKFCYVDFDRYTNIEKLLDYYDSTVTALKAEYPKLEIIHCTAPLRIRSASIIKRFAKRILKRDNNIYINAYNRLIRERYHNEIIFDIASLESTFDNGKINSYSNGLQALIRAYSSDGGHLNAIGQEKVAAEFLRILSMRIN